MRIGGFQKFSLIDYPGKVAAVIFTQGCNFRCGYCHNPQLVCPQQFQQPLDESIILKFLQFRQGKLQGVVVTGGEPTIQAGLLDFLDKLKLMKYTVKLDTNGSNPDILASIIKKGLVDFIAMDIKTSLSRYEKATGVRTDIGRIKRSIDLIIKSGLSHQFRTTLVKEHCSTVDLRNIRALIGGSKNYVLQPFVPLTTIIDLKLLTKKQYTKEQISSFQQQLIRCSVDI